MSLEDAFNSVWNLQARPVTLLNIDTNTSYSVKAASSNYFRNMAGPEEMVYEGKEFVLSKRNLDLNSAPVPFRNMRLTDATFGTENITEVREMILLGAVIGYRVRTG